MISTPDIKNKALELGFSACGVIRPDSFHDYTRFLDERVKTFPESQKLYEPLYANASLPEDAKSVIVCTMSYNQYKVPESLEGRIGKCYLFDTRIAYSSEYRAKAEFEEYLKISGINVVKCNVPARLAAAKAGLGKFGHNNFIYSTEHGSYIWIDTWAVDKELEYDPPAENIYLSACNNCDKCIKSCPTKALSGSFSMNRGKCITYLVCNAKKILYPNDVLDEETRSQIGLWLYGCDLCQDACPLNRGKLKGQEEYPLLEEFEEFLKPETIMEMDEDTYRKTVNPRFWYTGEEGLSHWKYNALRSMINSSLASPEDTKYHSLIRRCLTHEDPRIRELAQSIGRKIPLTELTEYTEVKA